MNENKIKVLQVTGTMNRGGAEVMLMDIYRNISADVHFDFLINYKVKAGILKGDFDDEIRSKGGQIEHIGSQWDLGFLKYIKAFKKVVQKINPDIVHIHMNAKSGVIAWAAKKSGINHIIIHSHADLKFRGSLLSRVVGKLELLFQKQLMAMSANSFWGCSREANESLFYKRLLTPKNSAIIKNAVDVRSYQNVSELKVKELRSSYGVKKDTIVFGNVGRVVKHKNVSFIIDVLDKLNKENIDFLFVFAGRDEQPNYLNEILSKAKLCGIEDKIKYLGVRDDIPLVMNSFDVFLGPALQEGFGLVAVEAQAAGVPSVLFTGFPKTVDMNLNLVTFLDNFTIIEWVKAIKQLPKKNNDYNLIKTAIITEGFDSQFNTKEIEERYNSLLK
jgi:glycosyltransferase EpsF